MAVAAPPVSGASPRAQSIARREAITAYLFIAPYLIIAGIFTLGLLVYAFYISFTDLKSSLSQTSNFIGVTNYINAFRDNEFRISLINVFWYAVIVTTLQTIGAILLAMLLNSRLRGMRLYRTLFYAPSVASSIVISMIFLWLYLRTGWINALLGTNVAWLQDARGLFQVLFEPLGVKINSPLLKGPSITWMALMAMNIFTTIPSLMVLFLAALQDIPGYVYEAAQIDGSTGVHAFFNITLPLLRPVIVLVIVLGTIGTFQVFDQSFVMTKGGPLKTTLTPVLLIYNKTLGEATSANASLAAAMAFILAAIIFALTYFQRRFIESSSERF
ncbi:MAG: sugar ABC transporter permease [Kouleothrix sp.]|jgi:multiple sugar transport system permease protein|nr:sugar ABC transporter permease [Kouleothrix sp.]